MTAIRIKKDSRIISESFWSGHIGTAAPQIVFLLASDLTPIFTLCWASLTMPERGAIFAVFVLSDSVQMTN